MTEPDPLARSRRELRAARFLAGGGFPAEAVSRAYYAAFHAAEAALLALGESRSKHSGVHAAFSQWLVAPGLIDADVARLLRSLFDRRDQADHGGPDVPAEPAAKAIADAEAVVSAVEAWLNQRRT